MCYVFVSGRGILVLDDKYGIMSYEIVTAKLVCSLLYVLVNNFSVMLDLLTTFGFDWPRGFIDNPRKWWTDDRPWVSYCGPHDKMPDLQF